MVIEMSDPCDFRDELEQAILGEPRKRAEAAEQRVTELEADKERLETGIRSAMLALETCTKTTTDVVWYDDITTMWEYLAWLVDPDNKDPEAATPDPVREAKEEVVRAAMKERDAIRSGLQRGADYRKRRLEACDRLAELEGK